MSKIEADRRSIPLFEVVEHIVGDLGQVALQYEDIKLEEAIGRPPASGADIGYEHVRAWWGDWQVLLPTDESTGLAWEGAWKKLSAAVRDGKLPVRGFRWGSEFSEEVKPEEFPELWHNRHLGSDLNVEYGGHRFLEFDECDNAEIRNGYSIGVSKVIWAGLCAISGAEILTLWPAELPATVNLNATVGVGESEGSETALARKERNPLPPLQERILEIAHGLWADGELPPRILDRDSQILKEWPDKQAKPNPKTIQRAFKHWSPDN